MQIDTYNPATGKILKSYDTMSLPEVNNIISSAHKAYKIWSGLDFSVRSEKMIRVGKLLLSRKEEFAKLMSDEMGKPFKQGIAEIEKCETVCNYFALNAEKFLSDVIINTEYSKSYVSHQPLGLVFALMPWNFPFWQVFRFACPALMAGNGAILKHSPNTTQCGLEIERIFLEAAFPENLFRTIIVETDTVESVIRHDLISAVTFTGSTRTGKIIASIAGSESKKTVLELGGSDPYIVLEDADLELALETCVNSRLNNSGQSCIAAKRFIVSNKILDDFVSGFKKLMDTRKFGDPMDPESDIGPLARKDLQMNLYNQVTDSVNSGAKLISGGYLPDTEGYYYPPTILTNVIKGMPAYNEELFGPVATIIGFDDLEEAIEIANDTVFGLGAAIFSKDLIMAENIGKKLVQSGSCFINLMVKSDPRLPFGGIKQSGYGRELSDIGIKEFINLKTICIR